MGIQPWDSGKQSISPFAVQPLGHAASLGAQSQPVVLLTNARSAQRQTQSKWAARGPSPSRNVAGEVATRSLRAIKRDFRELGRMIRNSGAQVISSILLGTARNRRTLYINPWLHGWCHCQYFGFSGDRKPYLAPGLLALDRIHLS